jgi:hypothetical protein
MALTGENFMRIDRDNTIKYLREEVQQARETFWSYMRKNGWLYDSKAIKLEKEIELAEHNLYCAEYEDNRRRTWK